MESDSSEYLQCPPRFWLFAAACYIGDAELLYSALVDLRTDFDSIDGSGTPQAYNLQFGPVGKGERPLQLWKEALPPCLSIAARGGHAQTVQHLLEYGFDINAVSPQDVTPLLAAVESRRWEVLKILLDPSRECQRNGKQYDEAMVDAARICDSALRWKILMLLTDNDSRKMSQKGRDDVFYLASELNDLHLAK